MVLARKRRSWQMLLPHIGDLPLGTYCFRNSITSASACASSTVDAFTRSIRPLRPCVPLFQRPSRRAWRRSGGSRRPGLRSRRAQLRVGDDDGDLDDAVGVRESPVISQVDPDQVLVALLNGPRRGSMDSGTPEDSCPSRGRFSQVYTSHPCKLAPPLLPLAFALALVAVLVVKFWLATRTDAPCGAPPRRGTAVCSRNHRPGGAPASRRLHARPKGRFGLLEHGVRRRGAAGLDASRRHRLR